MTRILAISGSLRGASSNAALLRALQPLAPPGMAIELYQGIGGLPHFNPDLDGEGAVPPPAVAELRSLLAGAAGVVVSSPEYAHGVPGTLKNALDWIVSSGELVDKPLLLLNASPAGGQHAQASLVETLTVMSARVLPESRLAPFLKQKLDRASLDPAAAEAVRAALVALAAAIDARAR